MSSIVVNAVPSNPILLTEADLEVPIGHSRKRCTTSTNPAAKKTKLASPLEDITPFLSSKRTSPQLFAGKRKSEEKREVVLLSAEKENEAGPKRATRTAAQTKADNEKLTKILEKTRSCPTPLTRVPLNFPSTMDLLEDARARNLQDARNAKMNGSEEPTKKKKKAVRNNYWQQFK